MAKLTLANLANLVKTVIDQEIIAMSKTDFDLTVDRNTISSLTVKIGKQIMNDSSFTDRLAEFEAEELPFGTTIEEYFIHMILPETYDKDGATTLAPRRPEFADPFYSKELPRKTLPTTVDDSKYENAMLGPTEMSGLVATILKRLNDAFNLYKYGLKRELIGEMIRRVPNNVAGTSTMITEMNIPTTTAEGEAWIKDVKVHITENSKFVTSTNNLAGVPAVAPSLVLLVKGSLLIPEIDVGTLAGAFNIGKVEIPVRVIEVEDFGDLENALEDDGTTPSKNKDAWAILLDPRGIAVHSHNVTSTHQYNAQGEFTNYYIHYTPIGYLSHFTNVHIWRPSA